jgi:hypothetical protein
MRKEDLLYEQRDRIVLGLLAKGWNTLAGDMSQPVSIMGFSGDLRLELDFTRVDPEAIRIFAHHAERGGKRELEWTGAASLSRPEEVEEALGMDEDIKVGDWVTWRDSLGTWVAKITSIQEDTYAIRLKGGGTSIIAREGATKIPSHPGEE